MRSAITEAAGPTKTTPTNWSRVFFSQANWKGDSRKSSVQGMKSPGLLGDRRSAHLLRCMEIRNKATGRGEGLLRSVHVRRFMGISSRPFVQSKYPEAA